MASEQCSCGGEIRWSNRCGARVCNACNLHVGLARCFCGFSHSSPGRGREELVELGETIDPEPDSGFDVLDTIDPSWADDGSLGEDDSDREPPEDQFRDDVEADADTLASAGYGTDEDYGGAADDYYADRDW